MKDRASFEGEELTLAGFNERIDRLGLDPLPRDWADLFTVYWPDGDLHAFALLYTQHLLELNCDSALRADGGHRRRRRGGVGLVPGGDLRPLEPDHDL